MRPPRFLSACLLLLVVACDAPPPAPHEIPWHEDPVPPAPDVPLVPMPEGFNFVRLSAPTGASAELIRIGLHDRVRTAGATVESRGAPSAAKLDALVALCADPAVKSALKSAESAESEPSRSATSSMSVELACQPLSGLLSCESEGACSPAFEAIRTAVRAAWDEALPSPKRGILLRTPGGSTDLFREKTAAAPRPATSAALSKVPNGESVILCVAGASCARLTAPERVEVEGRGRRLRIIRCATCTVAQRPNIEEARCDPVFDFNCKRPITYGTPVVLGSVNRNEIEIAVMAHEKELLSCFEKRRVKKPELSGRVVMKWVIDAAGRVSQAQVAETQIKDAPFEECLTRLMRTFRFNKPKGGGIAIVNFPFIFHKRP